MSVPNSFSANTTIESAKVNQNFTDIASEITGSLPRNGEAGMTGQLKAADGTAALPGMTFSSDPNTGFYRISADVMGLAQGGSAVGPVTAFPAGTAMLFVQTSAPTGWTKSVTHNDKALRIVSGTASSGGSTAFTTVFAARTIAEANLPAHTHAAGTLATASDGAHTHSVSPSSGSFLATGTSSDSRSLPAGSAGGNVTASTDSQGAHTHTISGSTGSIGSGTAMDFAVQYVDVIMATKD